MAGKEVWAMKLWGIILVIIVSEPIIIPLPGSYATKIALIAGRKDLTHGNFCENMLLLPFVGHGERVIIYINERCDWGSYDTPL